MDRDDVVEKLATHEWESIDESTVYDIIVEGCVGYDNMDDETLIERYLNVFGEEIEIN